MALSNSLNIALTGLRATQTAMDTISNNVANADSVGYSRRRVVSTEIIAEGRGNGVNVQGVVRTFDAVLQRELRNETSASGYTATRSDYAQRLERLFGAPGSSSAMDSIFNKLTSALQALTTDPASTSARSGVLTAADVMARALNAASNGVQDLRADAESAIEKGVDRVNELLKSISDISLKALTTQGKDAGLLDMRDAQITELSKLIDIRVDDLGNGGVAISTQTGLRLCDPGTPVQLTFDAKGSMSPTSLYNTDPNKRGVGTILLRDSTGSAIDLIGQKVIRSGELAALVEMRDQTCTEAQNQLDELAAQMATALSSRTIDGVATTLPSGEAGFNLDTGQLQDGNVITLDVVQGGIKKHIAIVRVDDPSALPLDPSTVPGYDQVVGVNWSGGLAGAIGTIQGALGGGFTVSNPSGNTLRIVDDGATNTTDVTGLSATITSNSLTGGSELPVFVDVGRGGATYTGAYFGGSQKTGFAARIGLNAQLVQDPSKLVVYSLSPPTAAGDTTRPKALLDNLTKRVITFAPTTGIGAIKSPYTGTVQGFMQRVVEARAANSADAQRLDDGQKVVQSSIESRYSQTTGVSVDQELSNLIQVQNAYAANARILSAVKDMMDLLMRM